MITVQIGHRANLDIENIVFTSHNLFTYLFSPYKPHFYLENFRF